VGDESDIEASWKAANFYCEAALYGGEEGACRLGMLYAFSEDAFKVIPGK